MTRFAAQPPTAPKAAPAAAPKAPAATSPNPAAAAAPPSGSNHVARAISAEEVALNAVEALKASVPEHIAESRNTMARRIYTAQATHADTITPDELTATGMPPQLADAFAHEAREMFTDMNMTPHEARAFVVAVGSHDPKASAQVQQRAAAKALQDHFGERAGEAHQAAAQLVSRDPRLVNMLRVNGLGNNPRVVLALAKAAMKGR